MSGKYVGALLAALTLLGLGLGLGLTQTASATSHTRDPQHKQGVYLEECALFPGSPSDLPVALYVALDGNKFAVASNPGGGFALDLSKPDGSAPDAVGLYSYGDDPVCTGNSREVNCHSTELGYFVGSPTPGPSFSLGLDWAFFVLQGPALGAYSSLDAAGNGARCTNQRVVDGAVCRQAIGKMRAFFATQHVAPRLRLDDGLCD